MFLVFRTRVFVSFCLLRVLVAWRILTALQDSSSAPPPSSASDDKLGLKLGLGIGISMAFIVGGLIGYLMRRRFLAKTALATGRPELDGDVPAMAVGKPSISPSPLQRHEASMSPTHELS